MADLIDKRDAVDEVARFRGYIDDDMIYRIQWAIRRLPTIEAEPVRHGEWIDEGYYADYTNVSAWRCSECGWHMIGYDHELFRYCPNCGAIMDV